MTGELIQSWTLPDEDASQAEFSTENPSVDIVNSIPGSPSLVDLDGDGLVDRLYVGDLEGKLWKLVLDGPGRQSPSNLEVMYALTQVIAMITASVSGLPLLQNLVSRS